MLLRTLKLENFMKHASKKIDFAPGVNLIVGPNAAGKSSIYDAIELVLTGRGSRYSNRSYYAGPNGDGYRVELELEHAGSVYLITYSYEKRSGSARLYRDGKLIADKNVPLALEKELGDALKALFRTVYVKQGMLGRLASTTPSERSEWLREVTGLKGFDVACEAVSRVHSEARKLFIALGGETAQKGIERELREINRKVTQVQTELEALGTAYQSVSRKAKELKEELEKLRELKHKYELYHVKLDELKELEGEVEELKKQLAGVKDIEKTISEYEEAEREAKRLLSEEQKLSGKVETLARRRKELEETAETLTKKIRKLEGDLKKLKVRVTDLSRELDGLIDRGNRKVEQERNNYHSILAKIKELEKRFKVLTETDVCPLCGQKIEDGKRHVDTIRRQIELLRAEFAESKKKLSVMEKALKILTEARIPVSRLKEVQREIEKIDKQRIELEQILNTLRKKRKAASETVKRLKDKYLEAAAVRKLMNTYKAKKQRLEKLRRVV